MAVKSLHLVSVGPVPPGLLRELEEPLLTQVQVQATTSRATLQSPAYAFNKDRNQYHSNAIMRRLVPMLEGFNFVIGVTAVDLFVPDSPFVFGEADREARVAVVSIARLKGSTEGGDVVKRRAQVETVHQAGHLLGLSYCDDPRCVMFFATSVSDCDRKGLALCNVCRNELQKLNR
ncbi:MAG TPA: non-proteolytic archaemetzincin-like protein [Myxococcales bacterium]|jgi:archaemetzincin|nr:non-proteolytic archaemetzincin-like protein [Myxococcales bacterium]